MPRACLPTSCRAPVELHANRVYRSALTHLGHVKATGKDVGGDEDLGGALTELLHHAVARRLVHAALDAGAAVPIPLHLNKDETCFTHRTSCITGASYVAQQGTHILTILFIMARSHVGPSLLQI